MLWTRLRRSTVLWVTVVAHALAMPPRAMAEDEAFQRPEAGRTVSVGEQVDLAGLLDLCADQMKLRIEYDAKAMKGQAVTLRLDRGLRVDELWALTNQLLASRGFATVQMAGGEALMVVPIAQAGERARVEPPDNMATAAGFVSLVTHVKHRPAKDAIESLKLVLSKPGGSAGALGDQGMILISDFKPRVDQALWVLGMIDVPVDPPVIERIPIEFSTATSLAASVTAAVEARNTLVGMPLLGKLRPVTESNAVLLVAPGAEVPQWRELIRGFDQREPVERRSYTITAFALDDVSKLIEQTARDPGPRGSGDRWRVAADSLTNTLIVTATPGEHEAIRQSIERLDRLPPGAKRPLRTFAIRNRQVREIVTILNELIQSGALDVTPGPGQGDVDSSAMQAMPEVPTQPGAGPGAGATVPIGGPQTTLRPAPSESPGSPSTRSGSRTSTTRSASSRGTPHDRPLTLTADEATSTIIAVGEARLLNQLEALIRTLDVRQAQVLIEVLVVSLSEGQTLDLGVELEKLQVSGSTLIGLSSLFGLAGSIVNGPSLPTVEGAGGTAVVLSPGDFSVVLRALQTINHGRTLSIPKVLVSNNQKATLDSVLQQPFTTTNASDTVATTSFGGTQDAGTTVTIKPQIAEADHLLLEYSVSLSSFVGESSSPLLPPPRQQNSLASVVSIPDSYTVVVGGLEITTDAEAVSQVPLLGSIPLVGEAFKNRSGSDSRSRFYVFIRSTILRHSRFEDLKYLSDLDVRNASIAEDPSGRGWPEVEPRVIR